MDDLTEKQRRFVEAYIGKAQGNATEAARQAGYKGNEVTLSSVGAENLRKPQIAAAIEKARRPRTRKAIADREEREAWLSALMRGELTTTKLDAEGNAVEVSAPMSDRVKANEILGKMNGDFIERREVDVSARVVRVKMPDNGRGPPE